MDKSIYSLCTFDGVEMYPFKYISESQYNQVIEDCKIISKFYQLFSRYITIKTNFAKLTEFYEEGAMQAKHFNYRSMGHPGIHVLSNVLLMNLLASWSFFLEGMITFAKKKFNEEEKSRIEKIHSEMYDNFFSYRLCGKLRNFAIHSGFILDPPSFEVEDSEVEPPERIAQLKYYLNKNNLLSNQTFLSAQLKIDLKVLPKTKIEMRPILVELEHIGDTIQRKCLEPHQELLSDVIAQIVDFCGLEVNFEKDIVIKIDNDVTAPKNKITFGIVHIPFYEMRQLIEFAENRQVEKMAPIRY